MAKIVFPLHGIRTLARWQSSFADVASQRGWRCPLEGWWFGRFSIIQFLTPFARNAKVAWFRRRYTLALKEHQRAISSNSNRRPSIVAHSFGSYILGYALLKYKDIRFDKIILCGSILPRNFPWDELINRGQVNAVRNEIGLQDFWAQACSWVVPGTGAAGSRGFTRAHENLIQHEHNLRHNEFFDTAWMDEHWMTFLEQTFPGTRPAANQSTAIAIPSGDHPHASLITSSLLSVGFLILITLLTYSAFNFFRTTPASVVTFELRDLDRDEPIERQFELTYTDGKTTGLASGVGNCEFPGEHAEIAVTDVECAGFTYDKLDQTKLEQGIVLLRRDGRSFRTVILPRTPVDDPQVKRPSIDEYSAAIEGQNRTEAKLTCRNGTDYHVNLILYRWTPEAQSGDQTRWVHLAECKPREPREFKVYDFIPGGYYFVYASIFGQNAQYLRQGNLHGPGSPVLEVRMRSLPERVLEATLRTVLESTGDEGDQQ